MRQDLEEALQNTAAAEKERDVARDLAASFAKGETPAAMQALQVSSATP